MPGSGLSRRRSRSRWLLSVFAAAALLTAQLGEAAAQRFPGGQGGGMGRPGPTGPRGDSMPGPRPGRGSGWGGAATGLGIGLATGIILGAAAANANQPPRQTIEEGPRRPRRAPPQPRAPAPAANGGISVPPSGEGRFVSDEVLLEITRTLQPQGLAAMAARHRLAILESQPLLLTGSTLVRARISDRRPVRAVLNGLRQEITLRAAQPNYLYGLASEAIATEAEASLAPDAAPAEPKPTAFGDPAQYMLAKLRLSEAHGLARGRDVLVAVIDSGIDIDHPELKDGIAGSFDALDSAMPVHAHGTAIAGAIAAHSRLMGVAPAARLLAIRAFANGTNATATSYAILRGVDHAAAKGARILNMSFAGPSDSALSRQLAAAHAKGMVLIAAAGNAGPKSGPLYPAADPNVIAVSATDANDGLFVAANRGRHIAISAPGVAILLPAPQSGYQMNSGTSFAAAHVSGVAALILERKPGLSPDALRQVLLGSARDLGPRGRDDQFGAGLADAYQAILALEPKTAAAGR